MKEVTNDNTFLYIFKNSYLTAVKQIYSNLFSKNSAVGIELNSSTLVAQ